MTAVEVLGSVDELTDRTGGSVDAATGVEIGPYRKSRFKSAPVEGGTGNGKSDGDELFRGKYVCSGSESTRIEEVK
jgi:hypothetical protein